MGRKKLIFYVFVSFLLIGLIGIFLQTLLASPLSILILAVIFKLIIGTHWKDSFKLAVINYIWILIFFTFFITADLMATLNGQTTSGKGLARFIFLMIIGIPLTTIVINWSGDKHFDYSLFDKILNKFGK